MGKKPKKKGCNQYSGTKPKALAVRKRDAQAIKLRLEGETLMSIAQKLGYNSRGHVRSAIFRGLRYLAPPEDAEKMRQREVDRTYEIETEAWEQWDESIKDAERVVTKEAAIETEGIRGDLITTEIVTTREGQSGNPALLDKILKAMERRAKLLGLDAPEKLDVSQKSDVRVIGCKPEDVFKNALRKLNKK